MKAAYLIPLLLLACETNTTPYYETEGAVSVSSVDIESQLGNVGGQELTITGSGFGDSILEVSVLFGNQNATVLEVTDSTIRVITPRGPVQGGAVDVRVGTPKGQSELSKGFSYKIPGNGISGSGEDGGDGALSEQLAYVSITNDALSCYGGLHNDEVGGCDGFAYTGMMGIEGRSEGLEFMYPKGHMPHFGGKGGFASMTDISWEEWSVTSTPKDVVGFDDENNIDGLRIDLGNVKLSNPALSNQGTWCADLPSQSSFVYSGTESLTVTEESGGGGIGSTTSSEEIETNNYYENVSVAPLGSLNNEYGDASGCYPHSREYDLSELNFCMEKEYEEGKSYVYQPEWPLYPNFFRGEIEGSLSDSAAIDVELYVEKAEFVNSTFDEKNKVAITLPPYAIFEDATGRGTTWAVQDIAGTCPQDDGDIDTPLSANNIVLWEWEPIDWDVLSPGDSVSSVSSYVKVGINFFNLGWFGGEGTPLKATITVPDSFNFDEETGKSQLSLPAWVLYAFPTIKYDFGYTDGQLNQGQIWTGYADPNQHDYGFLIITMDRVTEYTLQAKMSTNVAGDPEEIEGDFVFAYSTGDMGFFNYENPLDSDDSCNDCLDNDGDGWVDAKDPDCTNGEAETEQTTDNTCNDGLDNDSDGFIDVEDDNCDDGLSAESAECSDGIDNDEDGWIDAADPDCVAGIFEDSTNLGDTCNDGIDNDEDGWIDSEDPICSSATDEELGGEQKYFDADGDGIGDYECNDGIDNDGHGDIDADDYRCFTRGAKQEESSVLVANCANGEDDDEDGYIDGNDPDCERTVTQEDKAFYDVEVYPWAPDCYNGTDDDNDGVVDALDLDCVNDAGEPDGFTSSEETP